MILINRIWRFINCQIKISLPAILIDSYKTPCYNPRKHYCFKERVKLKRFILICFIILLIVGNLSGCNSYSVNKTYSAMELKEDFEELTGLLEEYHPMLYTNKSELLSLYEEQTSLIEDGMTEIEFFRILAPVLAKLNCGHTYMKYSEGLEKYVYKSGNYLPLEVKIINDKAYIYKNYSTENIPLGAEILEINGQSIEEILKVFLENLSSDGENTSFKYFQMNRSFSDLYFKFIDDPESFSVTYTASTKAQSQETDLSAVSMEHIDAKRNKEQKQKEPKLSIQDGYAVLTVSSFDFYEESSRSSFKKVIDLYFKDLKENNITNLIIDFRGNIGGDPYCASYIFAYLIDEPVPYFIESEGTEWYADLVTPIKPETVNHYEGNIYTLIDGGCFSTTGHICALLKYHNLSIFIGEETGGSFACTDNSGEVSLKNSKVRPHGATQTYTVAAFGLEPGKGIMPDYPITPTIDDYLTEKDAVMEYAVDLARK